MPVNKNPRRDAGFTLLEMMMAIVVLIIGLVGVAQLVPASLLLNSGNRMNSSSLVLAQRELDQMVTQPLNLGVFTDAQNNTCGLGDPTQPNQLVGSPIMVVNNRPVIDFSQPLMAGYSYPVPYTDPNDPTGAQWDVRWAVITAMNGSTISGKRFIVGARQVGGTTFVLPVTLDTVVNK
jgi:prepilin-type N-terminal cleavage/methylation domain-containing protein